MKDEFLLFSFFCVVLEQVCGICDTSVLNEARKGRFLLMALVEIVGPIISELKRLIAKIIEGLKFYFIKFRDRKNTNHTF